MGPCPGPCPGRWPFWRPFWCVFFNPVGLQTWLKDCIWWILVVPCGSVVLSLWFGCNFSLRNYDNFLKPHGMEALRIANDYCKGRVGHDLFWWMLSGCLRFLSSIHHLNQQAGHDWTKQDMPKHAHMLLHNCMHCMRFWSQLCRRKTTWPDSAAVHSLNRCFATLGNLHWRTSLCLDHVQSIPTLAPWKIRKLMLKRP